MNCLWIARDLPFPPDAGDRIYSAQLAGALAEAGASVRFLGFAGAGAEPPAASPVHWRPVTGAKRSQGAALFSALPIAAAIHDTVAYRRAFDAQLQRPWDAIVFDSYGSGWALRRYLATRRLERTGPLLVHVAHNQEGALWRDMVRHSRAAPLKRLALWQNAVKVAALERFVVSHVDLSTAINDEDAGALAALSGGRPTLVLTPGYSGVRRPEREITADCPKRVVLLGSFRWVVKQENLRRFVELADPVFHRHGIVFDVIGDVPDALLAELRPRLKATVFHGFVDDVAPYFANARLAVVPEMIGGGFKLKFLDYLFARLPVATIASATAGLPPAIRDHLLCCPDLPSLVATIVAHIDRLAELNDRQRQAGAAAGRLFDWPERGRALREAIVAGHQARTGLPRPAAAAGYRMEAS